MQNLHQHTHDILVTLSPSKLRYIIIHLGPITIAYDTSSIKQTCKQITLNISHFSSILPQAIDYILHMRIIRFQELALHKILLIHITCNCNLLILGQNSFQNQFYGAWHQCGQLKNFRKVLEFLQPWFHGHLKEFFSFFTKKYLTKPPKV